MFRLSHRRAISLGIRIPLKLYSRVDVIFTIMLAIVTYDFCGTLRNLR